MCTTFLGGKLYLGVGSDFLGGNGGRLDVKDGIYIVKAETMYDKRFGGRFLSGLSHQDQKVKIYQGCYV